MRAVRPRTIAEAVTTLAEDSTGCVPLAGCTDWLVARQLAKVPAPRTVLDLSRLADLRGIEFRGTQLFIGAATTFSEIRRSAAVLERFPILAAAAATIGGWQIQNRATIGGNIANASPAGDSLPVLLALGAELDICGADGERVLPYERFHLGYRRTDLRPGELIRGVLLPPPVAGAVQRFRKVGTRAAQAISKVAVAGVFERQGTLLRRARIAAGSVAPTPVRLGAAEAACVDAPCDEERRQRIARSAAAEVTPIDDVRSTARYRRFVLERVVSRMLAEVMQA